MYKEEQIRFDRLRKMGPPCNDGDPLTDAHDFLGYVRKSCFGVVQLGRIHYFSDLGANQEEVEVI